MKIYEYEYMKYLYENINMKQRKESKSDLE